MQACQCWALEALDERFLSAPSNPLSRTCDNTISSCRICCKARYEASWSEVAIPMRSFSYLQRAVEEVLSLPAPQDVLPVPDHHEARVAEVGRQELAAVRVQLQGCNRE